MHRDELLYAAMGEHLRLFSMDFPPLIAVAAWLERGLFGESMLGLRLLPALAHGTLIWLSGAMAFRFGAGRYGSAVAAMLVLMSPVTLRPGSLFQPVIFDQLWWTAAFAAMLRLLEEDDWRWWLALGLSGGLGLLTKFSIAFAALGVVVALVVSPRRRAFLGVRPWAAGCLALAIGAPSLIGQLRLGWPVRGQLTDLANTQLGLVRPGEFLLEQLLYGPLVWVGLVGLLALLLSRRLRPWRPLAAGLLAIAAALLLAHGKPYYLAPVWPVLTAAGASWLATLERGRRTALGWVTLNVAIFGAIAVPFGLPVVPPGAMARYAARIGVTSAVRTNTGEIAELPQDYADMLGWRAFVAEVAEVWHGLDSSDRARAVIMATNYGRAGAIDWYGPAMGLPSAVAPVGSYWFFGPGERAGEVMLIAGGTREDLAPWFAELRLIRTTRDARRVEEEREVDIWLARSPVHTLQQSWPTFEGNN
jgi:4-amino-4-deoxy-L-arabinose transferase-like glycosyltransferase